MILHNNGNCCAVRSTTATRTSTATCTEHYDKDCERQWKPGAAHCDSNLLRPKTDEMNTALILRIADEIEAHPERYNQSVGSGYLTRDCPACVAVNALRLEDENLAELGHGWSRTAKRASARLKLGDSQAEALFRACPETLALQKQFPWISQDELDGIDELENWTAHSRGHLSRAAEATATREPVSFDFFWTADIPEEQIRPWRHASARVMAAVLRLIARGGVPGQ